MSHIATPYTHTHTHKIWIALIKCSSRVLCVWRVLYVYCTVWHLVYWMDYKELPIGTLQFLCVCVVSRLAANESSWNILCLYMTAYFSRWILAIYTLRLLCSNNKTTRKKTITIKLHAFGCLADSQEREERDKKKLQPFPNQLKWRCFYVLFLFQQPHPSPSYIVILNANATLNSVHFLLFGVRKGRQKRVLFTAKHEKNTEPKSIWIWMKW